MTQTPTAIAVGVCLFGRLRRPFGRDAEGVVPYKVGADNSHQPSPWCRPFGRERNALPYGDGANNFC
ncbi:MAG: hypothetical protein IJX47_08240 [Clostridia bacterium]|nr:hypothetical protein [Clostridia bacterium]